MADKKFARGLVTTGILLCLAAGAQPAKTPLVAPSAQPATPRDRLGRTSPKGTVIGFLKAARKGQDDIAVQYMNTRLRGSSAADLAHQLFVVLDRRLPPRLNELSDSPEGSLFFPAEPDQDLVGTITGPDGSIDITVERVDRGKLGAIWLFSTQTLRVVPHLFSEVNTIPEETILPHFLADTKMAGVPLADWIALIAGLPLLYLLTGWLNPFLRLIGNLLIRRLRPTSQIVVHDLLPRPVRLLILPLAIQWTIAKLAQPLYARQVWSSVAFILTVTGSVWLAIQLITFSEGYVRLRHERRNTLGAVSILRFIRRAADLVVIFAGLLVTLRHFGVNLTAALAGLGVGGIAVALAAQKTLENVIGGLSLVFDQTVHVGDSLGIGTTSGTVTSIGVRSTCLRTSDRTLVSVPNGQIANASLENFSVRDKFRLNHILGLHYGTTAQQIRKILVALTRLFADHPLIEPDSARVQLVRFGPSSLDVEIFAYCFARDWNHFLDIQSELLLKSMDIVQENGAMLAIPAQTLYLANSRGSAKRSSSQNASREQPAHEASASH